MELWQLVAVAAEFVETMQVAVQVVLVSLSLKLTNLSVQAVLVLVAVTSLINQLNKVVNIFSNKEEF
jgi:hypothetical protein